MNVGPLARVVTLIWDGRFSLVVALLAGFGRAAAEVGAIIIVGGNIDGFTRTMTTAIALETSKGDLPLAIGPRRGADRHRRLSSTRWPGCCAAPANGWRDSDARAAVRSPDPLRGCHVQRRRSDDPRPRVARVQPGAPTVLIGPNGAGKTTLLRLAMGLIPPSRGRVTLGRRGEACRRSGAPSCFSGP